MVRELEVQTQLTIIGKIMLLPCPAFKSIRPADHDWMMSREKRLGVRLRWG